MSIKFELVSFELGGVLPYGWSNFLSKFGGKIMGHEFTMVGVFRIVSKWNFSAGKTVTPLPSLRWAEKEFWWEGDGHGGFVYKGDTNKGDLYQTAPKSPTWSGLAQGNIEPYVQRWVSHPPGDGIPIELRSKLLTPQHCLLIETAKADLHALSRTQPFTQLMQEKQTAGGSRGLEIDNKLWFLAADKLADKKRKLPCAALDRPGMALSGGSGQSGGGFVSKTTSPTRRRVLQFDLGIAGSSTRFTATQVLETVNGEPSISKFIIPGQSDDWCKDIPEDYLAYWRSRLNPLNVADQSFTLESQQTLDEWKSWSQQMDDIVAPPKWVSAKPITMR